MVNRVGKWTDLDRVTTRDIYAKLPADALRLASGAWPPVLDLLTGGLYLSLDKKKEGKAISGMARSTLPIKLPWTPSSSGC